MIGNTNLLRRSQKPEENPSSGGNPGMTGKVCATKTGTDEGMNRIILYIFWAPLYKFFILYVNAVMLYILVDCC